MGSLIIPLIMLAGACLICAPIALIVSIIALNKAQLLERHHRLEWLQEHDHSKTSPVKPTTPKPQPPVYPMPEPVQASKPSIISEPPVRQEAKQIPERPAEHIREQVTQKVALNLEQRIGTRWVLIAGVITIFVAAGFFLKYAYDNDLIGPLGRVLIAAAAGLAAQVLGETTRRRGYEIVAKGTTALGFGILYATIFASYRFYGLTGSTASFVIAICITVAAMLYATVLDEVLIAFLALLGGFMTPVLLSTGENRPNALFCYVLVLGGGAILCSFHRRWRAINILAFAGTFMLYTGWFEKFYRPATHTAEGIPEQLATAMTWLGIFFVIYLVLPILYSLLKKIKSRQEDVLLVLVNASAAFYYVWTMLYDEYKIALALCALVVGAVHLGMMFIVRRRCRDDIDLKTALLCISLIFFTLAIPLYFSMYAIAIAWAAEGVILVVIGLRYRNGLTQAGGAIALLLGMAKLTLELPMHTAEFRLVLNSAFGSWCFVAAALLACHIIYRKTTRLDPKLQSQVVQVTYAAPLLLLLVAVLLEWWCHCQYNVPTKLIGKELFFQGSLMVFAVWPLLLLTRPICPRSLGLKVVATVLAAAGSAYLIARFPSIHTQQFTIFLNTKFMMALLYIASLVAGTWLLSRSKEEKEDNIFTAFFGLCAIVILWVLLTQEIYLYWNCRSSYGQRLANWRFLSHMYISVMWAAYGSVLMVAGFWRNIRTLRFMSLGLFALLLAKAFIIDTSSVKSMYRITAFLATGVSLVAVSYLYQFLKKKGFFDTVFSDKTATK